MIKRQAQALAAIRVHIDAQGYPPTTRELARLMGLKSSSTAHGLMQRLKDQGYIDWEPARPRTLRVIGDAP